MSRQKLKYATNQQMVLDIRPKASHNIPPEASRLSFNCIVPVNEANCFNIKFVHQPSSTARVATQRTLNTTHFRIFMSNGFEKYKFHSMLPLLPFKHETTSGNWEERKKGGKGEHHLFSEQKKRGKRSSIFYFASCFTSLPRLESTTFLI